MYSTVHWTNGRGVLCWLWDSTPTGSAVLTGQASLALVVAKRTSLGRWAILDATKDVTRGGNRFRKRQGMHGTDGKQAYGELRLIGNIANHVDGGNGRKVVD